MKGKIAFIFVLCVSLSIALSGCGGTATNMKRYNPNAEFYSVPEEIVANNGSYSLLWNDETGDISFFEKASGLIWSAAPAHNQSEAQAEATLPQMRSPITISYYNGDTNEQTDEVAYTNSVKKGNFSAEKIDNGICVTYYFASAEISVPVEFTISDDCFNISIDPKGISENANKLYSVSVMPFLSSVNNTSNAGDNYLFVPSGSGALVYPKVIGDGVTSLITQSVYGTDRMDGTESKTNTQDIKMPVFGAKIGNNAVFAVINKGSECCNITTNIGSSTYGYSTVYPTFSLRGKYYCESSYMQWYTSKQYLFSDNMVTEKLSVNYYTLNGDKADYSGMAECYRNYLNKSGELKKSGEEKLLNLKFYGGEQVTTFTLGIPHSKLQVMTDFKDVTEIINDISSQTGSDINALLLGFGTTGNTVGKIGGGFTSSAKFGSTKELQSLKNGGNVSLFYNFDILRYSENGKGVSGRSAAYTALNEKNYLYEYDIVTAEQDTSGLKYLYVTRDKLIDLAQKANKSVKSMKINGVCFDTLTYQTYSDYRSNLYNSKSSTYKQVSYILKQSAKEEIRVVSVSANIYAALESVNVYDAPTSSAKYQVYDVDVPFYQMVLKGYVPMSVYSVNLSENPQKALLNAVETGLGLTYTLIDEYDTSLIYSADNIYFNSVYDDVKDLIISQADTYNEVFKEVKGSPIAGHELINKNVRATRFENGTTVYVNYSDSNQTVEGTQVPAMGFCMKKAGES